MTNLDHITLDGERVPVITTTSLVIGTGSAGYNAAVRLAGFGAPDVVMAADKIRAGASRNAGSDKQTYYKLTLSGAPWRRRCSAAAPWMATTRWPRPR